MNNRVNNSKDFIVKVVGKKIVIYAINDQMVEIASQWFVNTFCGSVEDFKQLHGKYEFIYTADNDSKGNVVNKVNGADVGRFKIVLPSQISYLVGRQFDYYSEYMNELGYSIVIGEERDAEETYEILVGDTSRDASKSVKVEGDNWVIKVIGNKLVIKGGSLLATYRAAEEFYNLVKTTGESKTAFDWSDGYTLNGKYDALEEGTYTLNFEDEFDSSAINVNHWGSYRYVDKTIGDSCFGGKQYPVDWQGNCDIPEGRNQNLIYQADGKLHIGSMLATEKDFAYGDVSTVDTMIYRYGYIEFKAKLGKSPSYTGMWINGSTNNGSRQLNRWGGIMNHSAMTEIDVLENFSSEYEYHSNVHHWFNLFKGDGISTSGNGHNSLDGDSRYNGKSLNNKKLVFDHEKNGGTLADDFHIFSCYWDDTCIDFAFDGKRYLHYDFAEQEMPSASCGLLYVIMENGLGSATYGETYNRNKHDKRYEAQWDYVKIYQSNRDNCQMVYSGPAAQKPTLKYVYPEHDVLSKY
jgi:hypothetical protein